MSEFNVEEVCITEMVKHPNADQLSIVNVHGGYPVIVRTEDFKIGDLAIYIPVDALVPTNRPEFAFLAKEGKTHHRVRAMKLRKVFSMGMLVKTDVPIKELDILKYEPPVEAEGNRIFSSMKRSRTNRNLVLGAGAVLGSFGLLALGLPWWTPAVLVVIAFALRTRTKHVPNIPFYDIEGLRRHKSAFAPGEEVWITEKIHGCNARYVYTHKQFFIGTRRTWRTDGVWADAAKKYDLENKLKKHPDIVLFGEVFGPRCQDLHYGVVPGDVGFLAFDAMNLKTREYMDVATFRAFCNENDIPKVPTLYAGPWDPDQLLPLAEGRSLLAPHVREGFVVKPIKEETHPGLGRKFLKYVGEGYLTR